MKSFTGLVSTVGSVVVTIVVTVAALAITVPSYAQEAVRPEIGKPLQAAQALIKSGRYKEALAKIREVDGVGGKSGQESYLIESMRGSAASGAGETDTAIRAFESVLASGRAGGNAPRIIESLAGMAYRARDFSGAIKYAQRYYREGGTGGSVRTIMIQSYFQNGDFANTAKESLIDIQSDEKAGRTPSEEKLQLLANSYLRQKNNTGYVSTIEKLLAYYPKKSLWADVLQRVQKKPGFSDRLSLDVFRLQLATENMSNPSDYMEMAQLALQEGYPSEAKKVVDAAYAAGAFGKGAEVERQKRLKDLVEQRVVENTTALASGKLEKEAAASKDGTELFKVGYNLFTAGQATKGLPMMDAAIKKGGMRRPEDAKLRQGIALIQSSQKSKGVQLLKTITGQDGVQDLASLWVLFSK